jgi:two-component system, cell cycle sensor histidine kinase and response regulator CckA
MTEDGQLWLTPALIGLASIALGVGIAAVVRRRNLRLLERAQTAEASAQRMRASEERFRCLFDRGADPQILCDGQRVIAANPAAMALLAYGEGEALIGVTSAHLTRDAETTFDDDSITYETLATAADGTVIPVSLRRTRIPLDTGDVVHYQLRDLRETKRLESERRELEGQLLASQRLEALGTLAGGVAHDFNNLLTVIRANSEIAQIAMHEHDAVGVAESLTAVVHASDRARDIVKQILLFSRRSVPAHARINIAALITDTQTLLRATIPTTVQLLVEVRHAGAWINGDATQMQQLLLNLCSNAEHAMRLTHGGMLRVTVDALTLGSDAHAARHPHLAPGDYVRMLVRDTGSGMSAAVRQRIFEPFFTTKPVGEGTGLGLAVLHGIVMSHHGSVHVESTEGGGTLFELLFRQVSAPVEGANVMFTTPPFSASLPTTRERGVASGDAPLILIVDDEPGILRATERGLIGAGMRVVTAGSATVALELIDDFDDIAVLVTDQTMPDMTGLTLAEQVRALRPLLPIILSTGYTGRVTTEQLQQVRIETVLEKPYTLTQLTDAIQGALRSARRARVTQRA